MSTVTLTGIGTNIAVRCPLGDDIPRTEGGANWRTETRPKRKPLTIYDGQVPRKLTLAILFDRFNVDGNVERDIALVEALTTPISTGGDPPHVKVSGPVPHSDLIYVVTGLEWGAADYNSHNQRSRQAVTITLTEYVAGDQVTSRTPTTKKAPVRPGTVTARKGDTLEKIAARVLHKAARWREIQRLNPTIKNPRAVLRAGQTIKVPRTD